MPQEILKEQRVDVREGKLIDLKLADKGKTSHSLLQCFNFYITGHCIMGSN